MTGFTVKTTIQDPTFQRAFAHFEEATHRSISISEGNIGLTHTGRQRRALFVFSKLIGHNLSIIATIQKCLQAKVGAQFLDHFSVAALGRASLEACLMTAYIAASDLTSDSWNLRRHVLYLHDLTNRKRFLEAMTKFGDEPTFPFFENYSELKADLKKKIDEYGRNLKLSRATIEEYKKGQTVYLNGVRGAAREVGWDVNHFEFLQSYLSAFVHSHPVSFMSADRFKISFNDPSEFQIHFCTMVLETIADFTDGINDRMEAFSDPAKGDPLGHIE